MIRKKPSKNSRTPSIPLSAVVYCEAGVWLAHCLELDIVAEGHNPTKALDDLMELAAFQISAAEREGDLESIFRPAPPEYWKMFWLGTERRTPRKPEMPINRFEVRELELV
jgi:hypothetical protein